MASQEEKNLKFCRICGERGDHWTVQCPNQEEENSGDNQVLAKGLATKKFCKICGKLGGHWSPRCPHQGQATMAGGGIGPANDVQYTGRKISEGLVTHSQVIKIMDALEKENSRRWQILTKIPEKCFKCGLKMGRDCIHFDENGTYKLQKYCMFCSTHGDHWSHDCPKYEPKTFWAIYEQTGRIPWTLYKDTETKTKDTV